MASIFEGLSDDITGIIDTGKGLLSTNAGAAIGGAVAGAALTGAVVAGASAIKSSNRSSSSKKRGKTKKGRSRDRRFISKERHERAYQLRRKRQGKKTYGRRYKTRKSHSISKRKGVHYTKNGQPYILLKSGKARFVKKHSRR